MESTSVGALLRQVADEGAHLAKQEVALARIEFTEIAHGIGVGTALAVGAALTTLMTLLMLIFGIVLLMGQELFNGRYWIAALVIGALLGVASLVLGLRAKRLLSPKNMIPDQTITTLKEVVHG